MNDHYEVIDRFSLLVRPMHHMTIIKPVRNLTGISMDMLRDAPIFEDAIMSAKVPDKKA